MGKTTQWKLQNTPLCKGKVDLVFKKSFHLCASHERKETIHHIFDVNFYMFTITRKIAKIKNLIKELEIDLNRARKGKSPLNNAKGKPKKEHQPRSVAEIYTVRAFVKVLVCV